MKSSQTLLQIAADLSVGSVLLNVEERYAVVESLRRQLNEDISKAMSPRLEHEILKIHQSVVPAPACPAVPPPLEAPLEEEDDDVVFEGGPGLEDVSAPGFLSSLAALRLQAMPQANSDPRNIPPKCQSNDLFIFP